MPVVGNRKETNNKGYMKDPLYKYCKQYLETVEGILTESKVDVFNESARSFMLPDSKSALKDFFIQESYDKNSMTTDQIEDFESMMETHFENDREALLEYTAMATVNPVVGTTLPLHKNLIMNNVFTQTDAIPKTVAKSPKWTESMEYRYLLTPEGEKIDFFTQQHLLTPAMDATAPYKEVVLVLPEIGKTDMLAKIGASANDNLSVDVKVTAVAVEVTAVAEGYEQATLNTEPGGSALSGTYVWLPTNIPFRPSYGDNQRNLLGKINLENVKNLKGETKDDLVQGTMNDNVLTFMGLKGVVKAVKVKARKDTSSAMMETCSVMWDQTTEVFEIPNAIPLNVPISPEEIKDYAALYDVNQLTKVMSMLKIVLANYKDDHILQFLNESYATIDPSQTNYAEFDWAPRHNYALDHVEWRHKTFFDALDSFVTPLVSALNDPNVTVTFFGRPEIVRKITPTEYSYESPKAVGPVPLEFKKQVHTSDDRSYQFISSMKFENKRGTNGGLGDEMICVLSPKNTNRIMYKIYDYQLYMSNEIRNVKNYALPAVHVFERWLPTEYQPVQGRIRILNPTGIVANPAVNVKHVG